MKLKFAVVTAYYKEELDVVYRAIESVKNMHSEKYNVHHYLISDGYPLSALDDCNVIHVKLPSSHGDYGDTPRLIGALLAIREGSKGVMFLDADNIVYPDHLMECESKYINEDTNIILTKRDYLRPDGSVIPYITPEDLSYNHVDTGCFAFFDDAVYEALEWAKIPKELSCYGDRYFWNLLRAKRKKYGATDKPTLGYTCLWEGIYKTIGELPPSNAKSIDNTQIDDYLKSLSENDINRLKKLISLN